MLEKENQPPGAPPEVPVESIPLKKEPQRKLRSKKGSRSKRKKLDKGPRRVWKTEVEYLADVHRQATKLLEDSTVVSAAVEKKLQGHYTESSIATFRKTYERKKASPALLIYTPLIPGFANSKIPHREIRERQPRVLLYNQQAKDLFWPDGEVTLALDNIFGHQPRAKKLLWMRFKSAMVNSRELGGEFTILPRTPNPKNPLANITEARHVHAHLHTNVIENGTLYSTLTINDITKSVQKKQFDELTKVSYKKEYGDACLSELRKSKVPYFAILFDIDDFKLINNMLKHGTANRVLHIVSEKLDNRRRKNDILIRWGGDEFLLIIVPTAHDDHPHSIETIRERCQEIVSHISEPLPITLSEPMEPKYERLGFKKGILQSKDGDKCVLRVGVSTGIAYVDSDLSNTEVYNLTSKRMYEDKELRKLTPKECPIKAHAS